MLKHLEMTVKHLDIARRKLCKTQESERENTGLQLKFGSGLRSRTFQLVEHVITAL